MKQPYITVAIPIFNEQHSLKQLHFEIIAALDRLNISEYEVLWINDGSTDKSLETIHSIVSNDPRSRSISFPTNRGKSIVINEAFAQAKGKIIVMMDADLQDDPAELHKFIQKIEEGNHLVTGWKFNRQDSLSKVIPSKIYNRVVNNLTGMDLNDHNCGFKAIHHSLAKEIILGHEEHRFLTVLSHIKHKARIAEVAINHRPRIYDSSKYGWGRFIWGAIGLIKVIIKTKGVALKPIRYVTSTI